ncbi:hypothetical protein DL95DRAFT_451328 [Leptodontidium sp. 2 PMI_412]|nr:hypothetical protein DL95DRAFT_451328 [Leptodontidium sp. 2 PMI_412]
MIQFGGKSMEEWWSSKGSKYYNFQTSCFGGVYSKSRPWRSISPQRSQTAPAAPIVYFNALNPGTNLTDHLWSLHVAYSPTTGGVGIGVVRSNVTLLLATTRNANFTISDITPYDIRSVQHGAYSNGLWVSTGAYRYTTSGEDITIQLTQGTLVHIQLSNPISK